MADNTATPAREDQVYDKALQDAIRQEGQKWDFNKARGAFPWKPGDPTAVQIIDEMRGE
jgi:hypothetical protein